MGFDIFGTFRGMGSSLSGFVVPLLLILFLGAIIGAGFAFLYYIRIYNLKASIFTNIRGRTVKLMDSPMRKIAVNKAGDKIWFIKKMKRFILPSSIPMGTREYWFFLREDDELIPIGLENVDKKMKEMGVFYVDSDVRMARTNIHKYVESVYKKKGFWQKYGQTISFALFAVLVTVCLIVLFIKLTDVVAQIGNVAKETSRIYEAVWGTAGKGIPLPSTPTNASQTGLVPV